MIKWASEAYEVSPFRAISFPVKFRFQNRNFQFDFEDSFSTSCSN